MIYAFNIMKIVWEKIGTEEASNKQLKIKHNKVQKFNRMRKIGQKRTECMNVRRKFV